MQAISGILATLVLFLLLELPHRLEWINLQAFGFLPLELIILGLLLFVPGRAGVGLRAFLSLMLGIGMLFKAGDLVVYQLFDRPFNPLFDLYLVDDGLSLVGGAFGSGHALVLALFMVLILTLSLVATFFLLGSVQRQVLAHKRFVLPGLLVLLLLWILLKLAGVARVNTFFTDELLQHADAITTGIKDKQAFAASLQDDALAQLPADRLFSKLRGKDVLLVFVESYGRTVFDTPDYADVIKPLLQTATEQLAINGLQARSGWLQSPTYGGLSWLAHGTLLTGLWVDNQVRYNTLLMSERSTLNRLFQKAGWRTMGVMPEIIKPWPEARYFGFDQVYPATSLGYKGLPFGWITMPDQYTLAAYQMLESNLPGRKPLMAEIALVSSHTPWAPLPQLVPWGDVGDGAVFNAQTLAPPDVDTVWEDEALIRQQYRKSIEYVMNTVASYAINFCGEDCVMIVVGDHQPLPLVAGGSSTHDVPIHIITGSKEVLEAARDWQWSEGLLPAADAPSWRMDAWRNRFIETFSTP